VTNSGSETKTPEVRPETLIGAIVATFVFGLVAISVLMGVTKVILQFEAGIVLAFGLTSFLALFALEAVFIRLLLMGKRGAVESTNQNAFASPVTKELNVASPPSLGAPMPSVTENTTRTFDPIYEGRNPNRP
jgi:hypothetical protein